MEVCCFLISFFYIVVLKDCLESSKSSGSYILTWFLKNWDMQAERPIVFARCVTFKQKAENYFASDLLVYAPLGDWDDDY